MASTFFGLEIGRRALAANQLALDVVGQNTSNVNTPGYSRQVVSFDETDPYTQPDSSPARPGNLGSGVTVASITRIRDQFIDKRVLAANSDSGSLSNLKEILGRVQEAFNEPGNTGVGQLMTDFFNSFSDLSANPESGAIRSTVRNRAETLVAAIHSVNTALNQINPEIQSKVNVKVGNVNDIAKQIAILNKQIRLSVANGDHPNDLEDKRGALLDTLSGLVDVQTTPIRNSQTGQDTGAINVTVGGFALVQDDAANALPATLTTSANTLGLLTPTNDTIPLHGGEIYGLIKATTLLATYQTNLNALTGNLINAVNTQHAAGYGLDGVTGRNFFSGTDAASIAVSVPIESSLDAIAAAGAPTPPNTFAPGNGDNARLLASLSSTPPPVPPPPTTSIGSFTLDEYYNSTVSLIGADAQSFQTQSDNQDKVVSLLKSQQSSVSGVSLDEELTHMLQYQRSFQAAAKIVNTMDSVLTTILSGIGHVATT